MRTKLSRLLISSAFGASCAAPASAQFVLIDDFEGHTLGAALEDDANWARQAGDGGGFQTGTIIDDGGSQAAQIRGGAGNATYYVGLGANAVADSTTGTLFFRFRTVRAPWFQFLAYLSDWQPNAVTWWDHDEAGFYGRYNTPGDGTALVPQWDEGSSTDVDGAVWYNVWVVADNTANTYDLYLSQGTDGATGGASSVTAGTGITFSTAAGDLDYLFFGDPDGNALDGGVVDDIYVDTTGANLTHPLVAPTGLFWDGTDSTADADGGDGTWDVGTATNWDDAPTGGADTAWTQGETATFGGAAGTVTLGEPISADGLVFLTEGYTITGNTLTLGGTSPAIIASENTTISSSLAGSSGFGKSGDGALTLSGSSLGLTGTVTVAGGRLNVGGDLGASLAVNDDVTLGGEGSTIGDLQLGSTGGIGATLAVDVDSPSTLLGNNLTLEGETSLLLEGTVPFGSAIPLISYGGTLTNNSPAGTLDGAFTLETAYRKMISVNSSTFETLELTLGAPESITWTNDGGGGTGFWSFGGAQFDSNWSSSDGYFYAGDSVTFDDTAPGTVQLDDLDGALEPASVTFSNTIGNDYTLTGSSITGSGGLLVNNGGTVILEQNNSFTGGTTVDNGTLELAEPVNDGNGVLAGEVTVNANGTLIASQSNVFGWGSDDVKINTLNINGGAVHTTLGAPNPGPDNGWNIEINMTGGELGNMGDGIGYFSLGGYPQPGEGSAINTLASGDTALISANLVLRENNSDGTVAGQFPVTVAAGAASPDLEVSGDIVPQGAGRGLTKLGAGDMLLSGTNTWNGPTLANEGCTLLNDIFAIPDLTQVTVADGAGFGGIVGASNLLDTDIAAIVADVTWDAGGDARLVLDTNGANVTVAADIVGNFKILKKGAGDLTLTGTVTVNDIIEEEGTVILNPSPDAITIDSITTGPGTSSGKMVTIEFTASGDVDVYASDDLQTWGTAIAEDVSVSPFVEDDVPDAKRFYILVPANDPAP